MFGAGGGMKDLKLLLRQGGSGSGGRAVVWQPEGSWFDPRLLLAKC